MRFDQLPTELLVMIAEQMDMSTRGCVIKTSRRMQAIYRKYPHYNGVDRVEISCLQIGRTLHKTLKIVDSLSAQEMRFPDHKPPVNHFFSTVDYIRELSFRNMSCGDHSVTTILRFFPTSKLILKLSFDNCLFVFVRDYLVDVVLKHDVRRIHIVCSSAEKVNLPSVISDKFFSLYSGDFEFTVQVKKSVSKTKALVTDKTLTDLLKNPRKVFKLENIGCKYTDLCLSLTIEAVIFGNFKVDWDLGVLVVPADELSIFQNLIPNILSESALAVNATFTTNWFYIYDDREIHFEEYLIKKENSQIKFTVQLPQWYQPTLRKRPYQYI